MRPPSAPPAAGGHAAGRFPVSRARGRSGQRSEAQARSRSAWRIRVGRAALHRIRWSRRLDLRRGARHPERVQACSTAPDSTVTIGVTASPNFRGNGRIDFYVTRVGLPNELFENNGNGTFTDVARQAGVPGSDLAGVDNDGATCGRRQRRQLVAPNSRTQRRGHSRANVLVPEQRQRDQVDQRLPPKAGLPLGPRRRHESEAQRSAWPSATTATPGDFGASSPPMWSSTTRPWPPAGPGGCDAVPRTVSRSPSSSAAPLRAGRRDPGPRVVSGTSPVDWGARDPVSTAPRYRNDGNGPGRHPALQGCLDVTGHSAMGLDVENDGPTLFTLYRIPPPAVDHDGRRLGRHGASPATAAPAVTGSTCFRH